MDTINIILQVKLHQNNQFFKREKDTNAYYCDKTLL